jgi:hypothetical protein
MSKITQSAKGENCTVRVIGYCNGNSETVVLAHLNGIRYGHGTGKKVNDIHGSYCCSSCHDVLDGRVRSNYSKDELKLFHLESIIETQLILLDKGLIK